MIDMSTGRRGLQTPGPAAELLARGSVGTGRRRQPVVVGAGQATAPGEGSAGW
jgi:hypothetical protein